jgi:uncharacterized protein YhaN
MKILISEEEYFKMRDDLKEKDREIANLHFKLKFKELREKQTISLMEQITARLERMEDMLEQIPNDDWWFDC